MKKLIILLLLVLMPIRAGASKISLCNGGSSTELSSVSICNSGLSKQVSPFVRVDSVWYALISYGAEWRLVVGLGQSNMVGNPDPAMPGYGEYVTITNEGVEYKTISGTVVALAEPTGNNDYPFNYSGQSTRPLNGQGSLWLSLAKTYFDLTGQKIIVLSLGIDGASSTQIINYRESAVKPRIDACLSYLTAEGYDFEWEDILWCQGEADNMYGVSAAQYAANMGTLFGYFKTQYSSIYTLRFQMIYPYSSAYWEPFNAQVGMNAFAANNTDAFVAFGEYYTGPSAYHYDQDQLDVIGISVANTIAGLEGF